MTFSIKKTMASMLAGLLLASAASVPAAALEPHGTGLKMRDWLTNDPDYQFSEAYKTSVWCENFSLLDLGRNDRNNVLRIAVSQLGYHEGNSTADYHGKNTQGTGNYMEYGRLLVPNWNNNSYDWCACFVNWCLNQARFDRASSEISCGNWVTELKAMGQWQFSPAYGGTYTPKPADFIFFDWDESGKWPDHIGFVLYTTNTHVYTIEGNTRSDNVGTRSYALKDPRILGYGTPAYDEGDEPTLDYAYTQGMPRGIYVVNSTSASLSDSAGENAFCSIPLGSTVTLLTEQGDYALVSYGSKRGYLPKSCLFFLTTDVCLSYDANGGANAPADLQVLRGQQAVVSDVTPTREGDTFLGWSRVPYNIKVDYQPGDTLTLKEDVTLYAVWEKYSAELAEKAAAEGLLPEYNRPARIENSNAILLGCLNSTDLFPHCGDTDIQFAKDGSGDKVLSLTSTKISDDPYVTFFYGTLCKSLRLPPVTGETVSYVILRVKDVSVSNRTMELSFNGGARIPAVLPETHHEWQYLVFDLSDHGFTGKLNTLRIDWQRSASGAGNTLWISDIYFAADEAVKDAVVAGKYVYAAQEKVEPETEPVTEETTHAPIEPVTTPESEDPKAPETEPDPGEASTAEDVTAGETTGKTTGESTGEGTNETKPTENGGCASIVKASAGFLVSLIVCVLPFLKKKED